MKQMVEQLLQIMRLGDRPLQKEDVSARELKEHLLQVFQYLAQQQDVTLGLSCRMSLSC